MASFYFVVCGRSFANVFDFSPCVGLDSSSSLYAYEVAVRYQILVPEVLAGPYVITTVCNLSSRPKNASDILLCLAVLYIFSYNLWMGGAWRSNEHVSTTVGIICTYD